MQKSIAVAELKVIDLNEKVEPLEPALKQLDETDRYIRFYLPFFNCRMIFECCKDMLKTAPTPMKHDLYKHTMKKLEAILDRVNTIGTPDEGEFNKASLGNQTWMRIETETKELQWQREDEADAAKKKLEEET
jgi:hypothetical protein